MKIIILLIATLGLFFLGSCEEEERLKYVKQERFNLILCFPSGYDSGTKLSQLLTDLSLPYEYSNSEFAYLPNVNIKLNDSTIHIDYEQGVEKLKSDENFYNLKTVSAAIKQYFADEQIYKKMKFNRLIKVEKLSDIVFLLDVNSSIEGQANLNYTYFTDIKSVRDSISSIIKSREGDVASLMIQVVVYSDQNLTQKGAGELNIFNQKPSDYKNELHINQSAVEQENKYSTDSTEINNYQVAVDGRNMDKSAEKSSTALSSDININQKQKAKQSNYSIPKFEGQVFKKDFILIKK